MRKRHFNSILKIGFILIYLLIMDGVSIAKSGNSSRQEIFKIRIAKCKKQLQTSSEKNSKKKISKLFKLYKKLIKLTPDDEYLEIKLIEDAIFYKKYNIALHYLISMHTNYSYLTLIKLNMNTQLQNQTIKIRPFTYNFLRSFFYWIFNKEQYIFSYYNAETLFSMLNQKTLTAEEIDFLKSYEFEIKEHLISSAKKGSLVTDTDLEIKPLEKKTENDELQILQKEPIKKVEKNKIVEVEKIANKESNYRLIADNPVAPTSNPPNVENEVVESDSTNLKVMKPTEVIDHDSLKSHAAENELKDIETKIKKALKENREAKERYHWDVIKIRNDVKIQRKTSELWQEVKKGDKLFKGDSLKTLANSTITLLIRGVDNKKSYTQLFENTELKVIKFSDTNLEELDDVYLDIILGEVLVNVEDLPTTSTFKIKTPTSIAGVRGTTFSVKILSQMVSSILVLKGIVSVSQKTVQGIIEQMIEAGKQSINEVGRIPERPTPINERTYALYQEQASLIAGEIQAMELENQFQVDDESIEEGNNVNDDSIVNGDNGGDGDDSDSENNENADEGSGEEGDSTDNEGEPEINDNDNPEDIHYDVQVCDPTNKLSPCYDPRLDPANYYGGIFIDPAEILSEDAKEDLKFLPPEISEEEFLDDYDERFSTPDDPFYIPDFVDMVFYVDALRGHDGAPGERDDPYGTLERAMQEAKSYPPEMIILILLYSDIGQVYHVPAGGLDIRQRTGISGYQVDVEFPAPAQIDGGGSSVVFRISGGPVHLGNLHIKNNDAGIGVDIDHARVSLEHMDIEHCDVGIKIVGEGGEEFPPDFNDEIGPPPGSILIENSKIMRCDINSIEIVSEPTTMHVKETEISETASCVVSNVGGSHFEFSNSKFFMNNGSNVIEMSTGSDSVLEISDCRFENNHSGNSLINVVGGGSILEIDRSLIIDNDSGQDTIYFDGARIELSQSEIAGNTASGNSILSTICDGSSTMHITNSLFVDNNVGVADHVINHQGAPIELIFNTFYTRDVGDSDGIIRIDNPGSITSRYCAYIGYEDGVHAIQATNFTTSSTTAIFYNNFFNDAVPSADTVVDLEGSYYSAANLDSDTNIDGNGNIDTPTAIVNLFKDSPNGDWNPPSSSNPLLDHSSGDNAGINTDIRGRPRPYNGNYDIGCFEYSGVDPLLTGRIYDSVSGADITDTFIGLYIDGASSATAATKGSSYSFDVLPGNYRFVISKDNIYFPSQRAASQVAGDHGDVFTVIDGIDQNIDIPVDSLGLLTLKKSANKKELSQGEILTLGLSVKNSYWYANVNDILVVDKRISGFKLIPGSVRINGNKADDPLLSGDKYTFNLGTVNAASTKNLSYQVVTATGLSNGSYSGTAICKNLNDQILSNTADFSVLVIKDTLFSNSTLIGRVYKDDNSNGKYDTGEKGIPNVIIATEYGLEITTDEFGVYHLKNIFPGRHVLKVLPSSLPVGLIQKDSHGVLFEIFEGRMAKCNIPLIEGEKKNESNFFFIGLGEVSISNNNIRGNKSLTDKNASFDDIQIDGKGAFYLKGTILGKYLIQASYDSTRLSSDQKYLRRNKFLTNLDPDKYYPIYGDNSTTDYSASETDDNFFLLIEWEEANSIWKTSWGKMEVNWDIYRKTTHGGRIIFEAKEQTRFGDKNYDGELFYAVSDHQPAHEEFTGTGTSIYYLENTPVIEGSESIKVQLKNRFSSLPEQEVFLIEEIDYTIDYDSGRIILKRPLTSTIINYSHTIISNDLLSGFQSVLVVDYEYKEFSVMNRQGYGGKFSKTFKDHLKIEALYIEEERSSSPYKIGKISSTAYLNKDTYLKASYNKSEESFGSGGASYDGGITFSSQSFGTKIDQSGSMIEVSGAMKIDDLAMQASYSDTDKGYSALGVFGSADATSYSIDAQYKLSKNLNIEVQHQNNETESENPLSQSLTVVDHLRKTNIALNFSRPFFDIKTEYTLQDVGTRYSGTRYLGSFPPRGRELAALRFGWKPLENHYYYITGQTTLKRAYLENLDNDMITIGADFPLIYNLDLRLEGRSGTIGDSFITSFILNENSNEQSHIGFETGTHDNYGKFESISFSKTYLGEKGEKYTFIKDYNYYQNRIIHGDIFDVEVPVNKRFSLGFSYEQSRINEDQTENAIEREVSTVRYNLLFSGISKLFGKIEWRKDENLASDSEIKYIYFEDELLLKLSENFYLKADGAYGYTEDTNNSNDIFKLKKGGVGIGLRPKDFDWLNILAKFQHIYDLPLRSSVDFFETSKQRKNITSIDLILDIGKNLQFIEKFAFRDLDEQVGNREWEASETFLFINGINIKFFYETNLGIEYRILKNITYKDQTQGFLLQVSKEFNDLISIFLGYNFTDFDDNLANRDEYDRSGWFIRMNTKY